MKSRTSKDNRNEEREKIKSSDSINKKKMKRNIRRLGGGGLSLEAFANIKTKSEHYNPALIKKQREFYKNAKYVSKYKKSLKQQSQQNGPHSSKRLLEDENGTGESGRMNWQKKKNNKNSSQSLRELYERKRQEEEEASREREAIIQTKKEERERSESRRKALREKMFKKTKKGQPVMKYRIEHLLQTIQDSTT
ncbi:rRNA-processing protein FYV7 [Cornus florida]|uniref:rRNA-processing protein FYV7 n=1 Tax=Cornus florida TaxID=4283 RepID=UPI0028963727|nr:rRNA-processing protein FYV7 [Cornus florida]